MSTSVPTSGRREDIGTRRRHDDAVASNRHAFARRASARWPVICPSCEAFREMRMLCIDVAAHMQ
jgi:hypothetical protein